MFFIIADCNMYQCAASSPLSRQIFYYSLSKIPELFSCCEMFNCCCGMFLILMSAPVLPESATYSSDAASNIVRRTCSSSGKDNSKLFIEIPLLTYQKGLHISPSGKYLRAFHRGDLDNIPMQYKKIFAFAQKHNLAFHGFSYEIGMNENIIDRIEDYIVQIEISVPG